MASAPPCPHCKSPVTRRARRTGLLQNVVYPRLGLFPWECTACRRIFLVKQRAKSRHRHAQDDFEPSLSSETPDPSIPEHDPVTRS